jgi:hypothetical protein
VTLWQYRVVTLNTEYSIPWKGELEDSPESDEIIQTCLLEMGEDGWELVGTLPAMPKARNWKNDLANPWVHHFIFKRPAEDQESCSLRE